MSSFNDVTPNFSVMGGATPEALERAAAEGFTVFINNRPDGEMQGQATAAALRAAAAALGLSYVDAPIAGAPPSEPELGPVRAALAGATGPVLAACGSGTRSIIAWAMIQAEGGETLIEDLQSQLRAAGYNLPKLTGLLEARRPA